MRTKLFCAGPCGRCGATGTAITCGAAAVALGNSRGGPPRGGFVSAGEGPGGIWFWPGGIWFGPGCCACMFAHAKAKIKNKNQRCLMTKSRRSRQALEMQIASLHFDLQTRQTFNLV